MNFDRTRAFEGKDCVKARTVISVDVRSPVAIGVVVFSLFPGISARSSTGEEDESGGSQGSRMNAMNDFMGGHERDFSFVSIAHTLEGGIRNEYLAGGKVAVELSRVRSARRPLLQWRLLPERVRIDVR